MRKGQIVRTKKEKPIPIKSKQRGKLWDKGWPEKKAWLNVYILKKRKKKVKEKKKKFAKFIWTKCELYYSVNGFTIWKGEKTAEKGGLVAQT